MNVEQKLSQLESFLGPSNGLDSRNNATFICPNCNHPKPHLVVHVEKELYHCWICEFKGRGHERSLKRLGFKGDDVDFFSKHRNTIKNFGKTEIYELIHGQNINENCEKIQNIKIPIGYTQLYNKKNDLFYKVAWDYLKKRNLVDSDLILYNIHYNVEKRRFLIPSLDKDLNINYYITRTIDNETTPKYENPPIKKSSVIFNEWRVDFKKTLYIVEGVLDAILSRQNAVPLLGSSMNSNSEIFKKILKFKTNVILALDNDAIEKQLNIAKLLNSYLINTKYIKLEDKRDVADIGEDIKNYELFEYSKLDIITTKLRGNNDNITHC